MVADTGTRRRDLQHWCTCPVLMAACFSCSDLVSCKYSKVSSVMQPLLQCPILYALLAHRQLCP